MYAMLMAALAAATILQVVPVLAQQPGAAGDEIEQRSATIISEGVRMHADIYVRKSSTGKPLPAIILSHGWGGTAKLLSSQASVLARAGYFTVAFDYRGWGARATRA